MPAARRHSHLMFAALLLLVLLGASLAAAATAQASTVRWVTSVREDAAAASFRLSGVPAKRIVRASVVNGSARRNVAVSTVRRGARRGVLRVSISRTFKRGKTAKRTRLRIVLSGGKAKGGTKAKSPLMPVGGASGSTVGKTDGVTAANGKTPAVKPQAPKAQTPKPPVARPGAPAPSPVAVTQVATALSDSEAAARVQRSGWEPRPQNDAANHRVPNPDELQAYRAERGEGWCNGADLAVTGNFTGTTDEILQWSAAKWGLSVDLLRAVAQKESYWNQDAVGDNGTSFGLMQVKNIHHGTYPLSVKSTAFNVDYYGAILRYYYDGCADWLNDVERARDYGSGDLWGSVGSWFTGRWYTSESQGYIDAIKQNFAARDWQRAGF